MHVRRSGFPFQGHLEGAQRWCRRGEEQQERAQPKQRRPGQAQVRPGRHGARHSPLLQSQLAQPGTEHHPEARSFCNDIVASILQGLSNVEHKVVITPLPDQLHTDWEISVGERDGDGVA